MNHLDFISNFERISALQGHKNEEKILNHQQIVADLSANYLVKTHYLIPVAIGATIFLFLVFLIFSIWISLCTLLLIPTAFIYQNIYDTKKRKALNGEYILKQVLCSRKTKVDGTEGGVTEYYLYFSDGNCYKFKGDYTLYQTINKWDNCLIVYLKDSNSIEYAYKISQWTIGEDIKDKIIKAND